MKGLVMLTYQEQIEHPQWQRRRCDILNRDDFHCRKCFADSVQLHVHHLRYEWGKMAWEYPDDDLVTLCRDCHKAVELTTKHLSKDIRSGFSKGLQLETELLDEVSVSSIEEADGISLAIGRSIPTDVIWESVRNGRTNWHRLTTLIELRYIARRIGLAPLLGILGVRPPLHERLR